MNINESKNELAAILYRCAKDGSTAILDSGKQVLPVALRYAEDATLLAMTVSMEDPEKGRAAVAKAVAQWPVLVFITEAWTAPILDPMQFDINTETPPSQRPDRQECVIVTAYVDGKAWQTGFLLFERKKDGDIITVARAQKWVESGGAISIEPTPDSIYPS
jgi:DNA polymerase elongation subunit (family B)